MAICWSRFIALPSILPFPSAATTALLWQCSFILQALDLVVQVSCVFNTAYISLKLMCLPLCHCGTMVLMSWAGVCMLDRVSPGQRK